MPKLDYHFLIHPVSSQQHSYGKYYTIPLGFPCLDGRIQTRRNIAGVKKSKRNTSRR